MTSLLNDKHADLRSTAAELVATLAQNNPYCQDKLLDTNEIFPLLIKKLSDEKESSGVKIKCLYATSCEFNGCGSFLIRVLFSYKYNVSANCFVP